MAGLKGGLWIVQVMLLSVLLSTLERGVADEKRTHASLVLRGTNGQSVTLTRSDLQKFPKIEVDVIDRDGKKLKYSGVAIRALLDQVGVPTGEAVRGKWMAVYASVEAKDNYRAVFGLAEFDPGFTERTIILADQCDGRDLDEKAGPFQIIAPGETRHARWVRMVTEIRVVDSRAPRQ
jgi:hypothetical protein